MPRNRKRYIILVISSLITVALLIWIRSYVFDNIAVSFHERIKSLNLSGFNVRFDSIHVDWRGSVIDIENLVLEKNAYDTSCVYPEFISIQKVRAEGIGLMQLLFRNILSVEALRLDRVRMVLRENSLLQLDSAAQRANEFTLVADRVYVRSVDIAYTDSARCETISQVKTHLSLTDLTLDFRVDKPFAYKVQSIAVDSTEVSVPSRLYTFRVRQAVWNLEKKAFRADSIRIVPEAGKMEFGRKRGFEIDRFDGLIPSFAASGIQVSVLDSLDIKIGLAEIQFDLKIFRDKRLRFLRKQKLLPVAQLHALPFGLSIDSLKVIDSFVQYEEFAEGSSEAGGIYFDNLRALFKNFSNIAGSENATLHSSARLFGEGEITLYATFPLQPNRRASIAGSIRNFNLPKLNAMLTPSTQIQVESGEMKELLFDFIFNEVRSDGKVQLNYQDLKVITFKDGEKANGQDPEKDNFKSFMMNTFVFRKNMTEDLPEEKRTGTINYIRDDARSIFNFWSKSLISGIKSAYDLDKTEASKGQRESRKEERISRREARRQKRAEKKRERG